MTDMQDQVRLNSDSLSKMLQSSEEQVDSTENTRLSIMESIRNLESHVNSIYNHQTSSSSQPGNSIPGCSINKDTLDVEQEEFHRRTIDLEQGDNNCPLTSPNSTQSTLNSCNPDSTQVIDKSDSRSMTLNGSSCISSSPILPLPIASPTRLNLEAFNSDSMEVNDSSDSSSQTQLPPRRNQGHKGATWVHWTANMEMGRTTTNQQNTRTSNIPPPSTPNHGVSTPVNLDFTPVEQNSQVNSRSKPNLWVQPSKNAQDKIRTSLRKQRDAMNPETKDDDQNASRATQLHFRYLAGVSREKHSFPRSPTHEDLNALPDLPNGTAPLGQSALFILKASQLSQEWVPDDEMGEGFCNSCEQRLRQYGIPFVGLSSKQGDLKADEWNRRTLEYCLDTFNCAMNGLEYEDLFRLDRAELDVDRIRQLMATHINYRINNKQFFLKDASSLEKHMKHDRREKRAINLAARRHEACVKYQNLLVYQDLFLDRRYCSSDKSDGKVLEEVRVRDIPLWRSQLGTALVEHINEAYRRLRQDEVPKRPGRKPGKRKTSRTAPVVGSSKWPQGLCSDCYDATWVASLKAKDRKALKMKPAGLQGVSGLLD
ncbi:hypothetical protein DFH28DRAFT_1090437 [Melampsora americana]|nr:hypothetical protein DFH28DRAFT_1090437 [Melampsora americana]